MGCGAARLWPAVKPLFGQYIGVDASRYDGVPAEGQFHLLNLDAGQVSLANGAADAAVWRCNVINTQSILSEVADARAPREVSFERMIESISNESIVAIL